MIERSIHWVFSISARLTRVGELVTLVSCPTRVGEIASSCIVVDSQLLAGILVCVYGESEELIKRPSELQKATGMYSDTEICH
jgi:hypothetical protein